MPYMFAKCSNPGLRMNIETYAEKRKIPIDKVVEYIERYADILEPDIEVIGKKWILKEEAIEFLDKYFAEREEND